MKVLIIEDEPASAGRLKKMVEEIDTGSVVLEILDTISASVKWLQEHTEPDLVFMDIHLADGLSFEIFKEVEISCPVIFTTAYDQYAIRAFKVNSIDYLLKPIKKSELTDAIKKFKKVRPGGGGIDITSLAGLIRQERRETLKRFVIRIGQQLKVIEIKDVAYFYIDEKIVFVVTSGNDRYPVDQSLDELERQLDPERFFRINRAFIISFESIEALITYSRARIKVKLRPLCELESISSTEKSPLFREWLKGK